MKLKDVLKEAPYHFSTPRIDPDFSKSEKGVGLGKEIKALSDRQLAVAFSYLHGIIQNITNSKHIITLDDFKDSIELAKKK